MKTFYGLASGGLDPQEAVDKGLVRLTVGKPEASSASLCSPRASP